MEILDEHGRLLRRHEKKTARGRYELPPEDRLFNPSRETARLLGKAVKIGPHSAQLAHEIFAHLGRPGQKAIYGLTNLPRHHGREDIERACEQVLKLSQPSYQALKRILERTTAAKEARAAADNSRLEQHGDHIRALDEYQRFFDQQTADITDPENSNFLPQELTR